MGNFDVGMESLVVGIYEFRNTCQRNGRAAELLGKQVKILELKEDIQKTY